MAKNFLSTIRDALWRSTSATPASSGGLITPSLGKIEMADLAKSPTEQGIMDALKTTRILAGRQTQPSNYNPFAAASGFTHGYFWLPKKNPQQIDVQDLNVYSWSPGGLINVLVDVSPEISKALWNKLRMIGTKLTLKAVSPDGQEDAKGQSLIDEAISKINPYYGGIDNVLCQMVFSIYAWGACAADSELEPDLSGTGDLFIVNPDTIYFERDSQQFPRPFQLQYMWGMNLPQLWEDTQSNTLPFRELNLASFSYIPYDPGIDDPYGRSPVWPALQVVFFAAQLFRDLQRVVENQAWPHTDFSLQSQILTELMSKVSSNELNSAAKLASFIQDRIGEIEAKYAQLEPRDAFVHPDYLAITQDTKGADLSGIKDIIQAVQREVTTALKEMPMFMDIEDDSGAETIANQFELLVHDAERYREIISFIIKRHVYLNAFLRGYKDLKIVSSWEPIRSTQRLGDAQAERVEIGNEQMKRDNGWQDNHQSSLKVTGTKAVSEPDWEHLQAQKQGGEGEKQTPGGEDKNTSQKAKKGSTQAKNAREDPLEDDQFDNP
jgi:hypothetical protein